MVMGFVSHSLVNLFVLTSPVGLPQFRFQDLARAALRERLVSENNLFRELVAGDTRPAMVDDVLFGRLVPLARYDDGKHRFSPFIVGDTDDSGFEHPRVLIESVFHLGAVDVLAPGDDHILGTVDDIDEVLLVDRCQISGMDEPVS